MSVETALKEVEQRIVAACQRVGRNPDEVTLIAVSKTKPIPVLQEAYDAGARCFGENKVQEIIDKYPHFPEASWHMIGHLQTNKVKYLVGRASMIHSVDSFHLAQAIEKECAKADCVMPVLVQVNVAEEESKFGVSVDETEALIRQIAVLPHVKVQGLMTIAPFVENAEENRGIFSNLYKLFLDISQKNIDNIAMNVLSMGMSGDFEVAIEEGATMVRVGTSIFGARDYR